ncbi:MAG TPA: N-6 DNA methylase [Polyangium sp.]|nr:N-6 DNA methylase [Polyangium sp.]
MITGFGMVRKAPPELVFSKRFQDARTRVLAAIRTGEEPDWSKLAPLEKAIRSALAEEFGHRCAYCGSKFGATGPLELDRFYPRRTYPEKAFDWENLLPACSICNASKGTQFPVADDKTPLLFHPRVDDPKTHFAEQAEGTLRGLTPKGTTTIELLRLNRPLLVESRRDERRMFESKLKKEAENIINILRQDIGITSDGWLVCEFAWILYLKILDDYARRLETYGLAAAYTKAIPERLQWRSWVTRSSNLTGEALRTFVNEDLFPTMRSLSAVGEYEEFVGWVRNVFMAAQTRLTSGDLLRQIVDMVNDIDFADQRTLDLFGNIYDDLSAVVAMSSLEFYTPKSITQFMVDMVDPKPGEVVLDPAMGTGGFLVKAVDRVRRHGGSLNDADAHRFLGFDKAPTAYLLATVHLLLHGLEFPYGIEHVNALSRYSRDDSKADGVDVIVTHPPFGKISHINEDLLGHWPAELKTTDSVSLFVLLAMNRLTKGGRASMIVPNGFLFGDGASQRIREKLLNECNLHTIVKLSNGSGIFRSPITVNILFFDKGSPTREVWYYEHPPALGKVEEAPTDSKHPDPFAGERAWWIGRKENEFAWKVSIDEIRASGYKLELRHPRHARITKSFRIEWLKLTSFRGFDTLTLELPKQGPAVLIGINGAGKSTILEAIAMHLAHFAALMRDESGRNLELQLQNSDIKHGAKHAQTSIKVALGEENRVWDLQLQTRPSRGRSPSAKASGFAEGVVALRENLALFQDTSLPVVCFYPATRAHADSSPTTKRSTQDWPQLAAYDHAFSRGFGPFQDFVQWFREAEDTENERRLRVDPAFRDRQLDVVRRALQIFLSKLGSTHYTNLRMERFETTSGAKKSAELVLDKAGVRLSIAQLSEGEKNNLLLVADLARRLAVANPKREDPLEGEGIILIDEIDLHLHPAWQRQLVPALVRTFPGCQFIASTHSPQVLSSVLAAQVRVIDSFQLRNLDRETFRRDSNRILSAAFDDPGRPPEVAVKLNALRDALDAEEYAAARKLVAELHALLPGGQDDPDVLFYEGLLPPEDVGGGS